MAVSDYSQTAEAVMCPTATLAIAVPVNGGPSTITVSNFAEVVSLAEDVVAGDEIMIGNEVMKINGVSWPNLTVGRGCADTIPTAHAVGETVWFFARYTGSDEIQYGSGDTVGVKLAPHSFTGGAVPLEYVPAHEVNFDWRFAKPYPAAQLLANGSPWYASHVVDEESEGLVLTWANRNRIEQGDQTLAHHEGSVTIEPGTTYTARVYDDSDTLVASYDDLAGTTWTYPRADMATDLPGGVGYLTFHAVREDFESMQGYRIDFSLEAAPPEGEGLGFNLGFNLGL